MVANSPNAKLRRREAQFAMNDPHSPPGRRQSLIPRKAVGGNTKNFSIPIHSRERNVYNDINSASVSTPRRGSFDFQIERSLNPSIDRDSEYHGYDIGEQSIPLVNLNNAQISQHSHLRGGRQTKDVSVGMNEIRDQSHPGLTRSLCTWLPKTLRWPYMTVLLAVSLGIGLLVLGLIIYSEKNKGLGADQKTPIFLFGWRFTPTLIAIMYSLLLMAMVDDIKRTEPYARLSRTEGASASSTLFLKAGFFLFDPITSLRRRSNNGRRNWALFWASTANIITLLVISPFSAALLAPIEVSISREMTFSRLGLSTQGPMNLSTADDSILFRTISTVLLNTTTSAWISNDYTILPFWPSQSDDVPLGAVLSGLNEHWTARTTVYQAALECEILRFQRSSNWSSNFIYNDVSGGKDRSVSKNLTSFVLKSSSGCSLGYATTIPFQDTGRGLWSRAPNFAYPTFGNNVLNGRVLNNASIPVMINSSTECGDRNILFYAPPWELGEEFKAEGYFCDTKYFSADIEVTAMNSVKSSIVTFDIGEFNRTKALIGSDTLNIPAFENAFLSQNWSSKFREPEPSDQPLPQVGGPFILVGAQNKYKLEGMLGNPNVLGQARQVKQRFLGESMEPVFARIGKQQAESVIGKTAMSERRIVASFLIGIILVISFLLAVAMITLAMFHTRLGRRPLNLSRDPASTMGTASLLCSEAATRVLFDKLDQSSEQVMMQGLDKYVFYLRQGTLHARSINSDEQSELKKNQKKNSDWRPAVVRGWLLVLLLILLLALAATLATLYAMYRDSGIYQSFLVTTVNMPLRNRTIEGLAPYSIIPTLIAVSIKLWWESIDQTFRRLQPYVSMARKPSRSSVGASSSYSTTPVGWLAGKAAKNKQWLLALVAVGAFLVQIFTVSMSALWDRNPGVRSYQATFLRDQEFRTTPAIFTYSTAGVGRWAASNDQKRFFSALSNNLGDMLTSWLYAGIVEGSSKAPAAPWTNEGWVFAPVNFTSSPDAVSMLTQSNVTLETAALRGRLLCIPIDMSNSTTWLFTHNFANRTLWNDTKIPSNLKVGYELKNSFPGPHRSSNYISFLPNANRPICCSNETGGNVGKASIGYWTSPINDPGIMITWVTGHPFDHKFTKSVPEYNRKSHWIWKDIPSVTAVNCTPIFEKANANVKVDLASGLVREHKILDTPVPDASALQYSYVDMNVSAGIPYSFSRVGRGRGYKQAGFEEYLLNMTASYGFLIRDALLEASDLTPIPASFTFREEKLEDRTFNFRLPGLNVDFPSYAALSLANNNADALHVPGALANISSTVFSMFFTHFVQAGYSDKREGMYMNGSWGLQPRGEVIPWDLGPKMDSPTLFFQNTSRPSNVSATVDALVSIQIEQLNLNPVAVFMSLAILFFLLVTTIVVLGWHRNYMRLLPRDVDTVGSVLGFVYASERLMALVRRQDELGEKGGDGNGDGDGDGAMAKMGWFEGAGDMRWGVEITDEVGGDGNVGVRDRKRGPYAHVDSHDGTGS